ncbi:MAG: hypothetical protein ACYCYI_00375 [Saccharofermentanales bacterium]
MDDKILEQPETTNISPLQLNMEYVLSRIDYIMKDSAHIHEAIIAIQEMTVNEGMNNNEGDTARGEAISHAVQSRETTNQQLLHLLEKMYDDLKPQKVSNSGTSNEINTFKQLAEALIDYPPNLAETILMKSAQQIFVKAGAEIVK